MTTLSNTLTTALADVADRLTEHTWLVTGSTARALSGFTTTPRDLDIEVAAAEVATVAAVFGLQVTTDHDDRARSQRAVGTVGGVELDITGGLTLMGPGGILPSDFDLMVRYATPATIAGRTVLVAPVEEQIVRILVSGNEARRARFVAETPPGFIARNDYVEARLMAARAAR